MPRLTFPNSLEQFRKCSFLSLLSQYGQVVSLPSPVVPGVTRWCYFPNKCPPLCCSALQPLEKGCAALVFVLQLLSWAAASTSKGFCFALSHGFWLEPTPLRHRCSLTGSVTGAFVILRTLEDWTASTCDHTVVLQKLLVCSVKQAQVSLKTTSDFALLGTLLGTPQPGGDFFLQVPWHVLLLHRRSVCK